MILMNITGRAMPDGGTLEQAVMSSPPRRVLVADADVEARTWCARALQSVDYDIVEAADGREALTNALVHRPALLITELRLPILDGYALCEILRRDRTTVDVPILVVTTETRPCEIDRARQAGATALLVKPAAASTLVREARRLLAQSHELRERSITARERGRAHTHRSANLLAHSKKQLAVSRTSSRFATTTPPMPAPTLTCPLCDRPLTYECSHIGGVIAHAPEQWDLFKCTAGCGHFEYRHRTHRLRRVS